MTGNQVHRDLGGHGRLDMLLDAVYGVCTRQRPIGEDYGNGDGRHETSYEYSIPAYSCSMLIGASVRYRSSRRYGRVAQGSTRPPGACTSNSIVPTVALSAESAKMYARSRE